MRARPPPAPGQPEVGPCARGQRGAGARASPPSGRRRGRRAVAGPRALALPALRAAAPWPTGAGLRREPRRKRPAACGHPARPRRAWPSACGLHVPLKPAALPGAAGAGTPAPRARPTRGCRPPRVPDQGLGRVPPGVRAALGDVWNPPWGRWLQDGASGGGGRGREGGWADPASGPGARWPGWGAGSRRHQEVEGSAPAWLSTGREEPGPGPGEAVGL